MAIAKKVTKKTTRKTAIKKTVKKPIPTKPNYAEMIFNAASKTNFKVRGEVYANKTMDVKVTKPFVQKLTDALEAVAIPGNIVCIGKLCFFYKFFGKQIKLTEYRGGKIFKEYVL